MIPALKRLAICPACGGELVWREDVRCSGCSASYPLINSVADLRPSRPEEGSHKAQQAAFFDAEGDDEWEVERPNGSPPLYRSLLEWKFAQSIQGIGCLMPGASVLTVCGGSGMDAELLARTGARVVCSDISSRAAHRVRERALRHGAAIEPVVADVEQLPFRDGAFDFAYVHDGLHHLADPMVGLAEMVRVARVGIAVTEPARAALTEVAIRLGVAERVEKAGNPVARLQVGDLVGTLRASGFNVVTAKRFGMFYRHEPGVPSRILSRAPLQAAALGALALGNRAVGRAVGNKLTVQAIRAELAAELRDETRLGHA